MNFVEIAGFLGEDAETRYTTSGKRVIALRVACRIRHNGKDETLWWRVNIWDERFDRMLPYLKKGAAVVVLGEMNMPEIYTGKDGVPKVSMTLRAEVVRFSPFGKPEGKSEKKVEQRSESDFGYNSPQQMTQEGRGMEYAHAGADEGQGFTGDDLPF